MPLPDGFAFSQSSLQDYLDCPRRFELKYLYRLAYPALETEPALEREHHMLAGQRFHTLVQQAAAGVPADLLADAVDDEIRLWWEQFISAGWLEQLPARRYAEYTLNAAFNKFRLTATYDLIAVEPGGKATILDWKTSQRPPQKSAYRRRVQTRLYCYLLSLAGSHLNQGQTIDPTHIQMVYWFPNFPQHTLIFDYTQKLLDEDARYFEKLTTEIQHLSEGQFSLTAEEKRCRFCNYRSLCNRGSNSGNWQDQDEDSSETGPGALNLDLDQIGEISF